jgi:hypothetical protein
MPPKKRTPKKSPAPKATKSEQELLEGFTPVPREKWTDLPYGAHIRYRRSDGEFRNGGYIKSIWISRDSSVPGATRIELANAPGGSRTWSITLDYIQDIWQGADSAAVVERSQGADELKHKINVLATRAIQLEDRIAKLDAHVAELEQFKTDAKHAMQDFQAKLQNTENDMTRTVKLIKEMRR